MKAARLKLHPISRPECRRTWRRLRKQLRQLWWLARGENVPRLVGGGLAVMALLAAICFAFEYGHNDQFQTIWDALWWAVVTMMTVGYGDKYPITWPGRFFAGWLMLHGVVMVSFLTAAIASVLVEKRMREEKGLGLIHLKDHFVLCGWNEHGERIVGELVEHRERQPLHLVLVNDLDEQEVGELSYRHPDANLRFVKGDFTQESTLRRANVDQARAVIILADPGRGAAAVGADQRTIIATLAVKSVAPDVTTCAELVDPANREHLERARVDSIIVTAEYSGFLLANAATAPGVPAAVGELLTGASGHALTQAPIPPELAGRTFAELAAHFRRKQSALLLGLVREKKAISLDDILGSDLSPVERFIKQKFEEADRDYFGDRRARGVAVQINPPDDYVVREDEAALVIAAHPRGSGEEA